MHYRIRVDQYGFLGSNESEGQVDLTFIKVADGYVIMESEDFYNPVRRFDLFWETRGTSYAHMLNEGAPYFYEKKAEFENGIN